MNGININGSRIPWIKYTNSNICIWYFIIRKIITNSLSEQREKSKPIYSSTHMKWIKLNYVRVNKIRMYNKCLCAILSFKHYMSWLYIDNIIQVYLKRLPFMLCMMFFLSLSTRYKMLKNLLNLLYFVLSIIAYLFLFSSAIFCFIFVISSLFYSLFFYSLFRLLS